MCNIVGVYFYFLSKKDTLSKLRMRWQYVWRMTEKSTIMASISRQVSITPTVDESPYNEPPFRVLENLITWFVHLEDLALKKFGCKFDASIWYEKSESLPGEGLNWRISTSIARFQMSCLTWKPQDRSKYFSSCFHSWIDRLLQSSHPKKIQVTKCLNFNAFLNLPCYLVAHEYFWLTSGNIPRC